MQKDTKFELSLFEELLRVDLHPTMIEQVLAEKETATKLKTEIHSEGLRIINEFKNVMCRGYKELHLEQYIQTHQRAAINLLDRLQDYHEQLKKTEGKNSRNLGCDVVYAEMVGAVGMILDYIEKGMSKYFDLNQPVPGSYRVVSSELLQQYSLVLRAKLKSKSADPNLQGLILTYVAKHCSLKSCTYQQQIYAKLFMETLLELLSVNKDIDWNRRIVVELVYLNFNHSRFFTYCRRLIAAVADEEKTLSLQIAKFDWFDKEVKKLHIKPNVMYKTGRSSLAELLLVYIGLELLHIKELQSQVVTVIPVQNFKERAEGFAFKLPLNLSVPQLALFVQLFIDVGVFIVEKGQIMTIMKFFAANVTTIGTSEISAVSLNNNRKSATAPVSNVVEGILREMISRI